MNNNQPQTAFKPQLTNAQLAHLALTDPQLATVTLYQIAEHFPISVRTLRDHVRTGRLPSARFGKHRRVTVAALKQFLLGMDLRPKPGVAGSG